jgi:anti-sigma-K factor RskA
MELTHLEIEELLGVYALDAVSPEEADVVEVHLRDCPRCRAEVADHREVAASLAHVGSTAPAGVWSRIAGSLEEAPPTLDMARVVSLRSRPARSVPVRVAAAVAAMAAAVIAVLGVQVNHLDSRTDQLAAALQKGGVDQAVQAALFDPGARRVDLRSEDGATFAQAVVRDNGDSYLVRTNLPTLPADQTYQLWGIIDDQAVSLGVLGNEPGVSAFKMAGSRASVLAVTAEAAGGVATPTQVPIVRGLLPVS